MERLKASLGWILFYAYDVIGVATFIYLDFFDGYVYNWYNWIVAIPVNGFFSMLWPMYWIFWHWLKYL
jgi:hypothetical protein